MVQSSSSNGSGMKVTVSKLGEAVVTLTLEIGTTVAQALEKAGFAGYAGRVDGNPVNGEDTLEDGDDIFVGANVKNEASM